MDDTIRVALYARVSSEKQADEVTIGSQEAALRQRIECDRLTMDPELCFADDGFSGKTLRRPALERLWSGHPNTGLSRPALGEFIFATVQ